MTHDDLMALADATAQIGFREVPAADGGEPVRVPTITGHLGGALYIDDADGVFYDRDGQAWLTGWAGGVRVRIRFGA